MTKNKLKAVVTKKINNLFEDIKNLKTALILSESRKLNGQQIKRINSIYKKLVTEAKNIDFDDIIKSDRKLYETFIQLNKELKTMSTRRRKSEGFLNESLEDLLETSLFLEDDADEEVKPMEADEAKVEDEDEADLDLSGLVDEDEADANDEKTDADDEGADDSDDDLLS